MRHPTSTELGLSARLREFGGPTLRQLEAERAWRRLAGIMWGQPNDPLVLGRYHVLEPIAAGAGGRVYRGHDPELDRTVAIKVLHRSFADEGDRVALLREARSLAQVTHPHVVRVYDVGVDRLPWGGRLTVFFVLEIVEGVTLTRWMASQQPSPASILRVFCQAAAGLAAAHHAGIVHRDFKPDNVLVGTDRGPGRRVCVADFGLAHWAEERDQAPAGTPLYMAPEQGAGSACTPRSDQFAFCVALYQALLGSAPYCGATRRELFDAKARGAVAVPPSPTGVPARVRRAILRGLAPDPNDRHASMEALLGALQGRGNRLFTVGGRIAAAAVVPIGVVAALPSSEPTCPDPTSEVQAVYNDASRRQIRAAFERTGTPFAEVAADNVTQRLDAYSSAWTQGWMQACRQTARVDSDAAVAARSCLDDRLRDLAATVRLLEETDSIAAVAKAVGSMESLGSPDRCDRPKAPDWADRDAVYDLFAASVARARSGARRDAEAGLRRALQRAQRAGDVHLASRAALELGSVLMKIGRPSEALEQFAYASSHAGRSSELLRARAQIRAVTASGYHLHDRRAGARWARAAEATLRRVDAPPPLWSDLWLNLSNVAYAHGQLEEAEAHARRAVRTVEDDPRLRGKLQRANNNLAVVLRARGAHEEARQIQAWVVERLRRDRGPSHPDVAVAQQNLGLTLWSLGRLDEAERALRDAVGVQDSAYGSDHPNVAIMRNNLAAVLIDEGRPAEAIEEAEAAIAMWGDKGPHPLLIEARHNKAQAALVSGREALAEATIAEAWALVPEVYAQTDDRRGALAMISAQVYEQRGHIAQAHAMYRMALESDIEEADEARSGLVRTHDDDPTQERVR